MRCGIRASRVRPPWSGPCPASRFFWLGVVRHGCIVSEVVLHFGSSSFPGRRCFDAALRTCAACNCVAGCHCMLSGAPEHGGCCWLLRHPAQYNACCMRVAARDPRQRGRAPRRPLWPPDRLSCLHVVIHGCVYARHASSRVRRAVHVQMGQRTTAGSNWRDCPKANVPTSLGRRHIANMSFMTVAQFRGAMHGVHRPHGGDVPLVRPCVILYTGGTCIELLLSLRAAQTCCNRFASPSGGMRSRPTTLRRI